MSASLSVAIPDIGDYKNVPVIEIMVSPGDRIAVDDPILSVESDKSTMEVPSPVAGVVRELLIRIGSKVSQGTPILTVEPAAAIESPLEESANLLASSRPPAGAARNDEQLLRRPAASPNATTVSHVAHDLSSSVHATPSVRVYARELDIDLAKVRPTGSKGRILREDVQGFIKTALASDATPGFSGGPAVEGRLPAWPQVDFAKYGEIDRQPLTRIEQISGANLTRNWRTIPHVTNFDHADVTNLETFRTDLNREKRKPEVKVTMVAFLLKSAALALRAFPRFNTSLDGDHLIFKKYVHIGFAVDTPKGLIVPIIRDVDQKGLLQIALEMGALAEKARQNALPSSDMQGGCFSVSSLGGVGGAGFTPIINAPEVAILGAARSKTEAVWKDEAFVPRLTTPISLSWDHRVVDGVAAARFLGHIAATLGDFRRALL